MENLVNFENFFKEKKILITGHTGFKGSWASIWLKMLGAEVYGYALEPSLSNDNFATCNLQKIINHEVGDICDSENLLAYFKQVKPDIAFHFAAQPLVLKSYLNPVETFQTNIMGAINFFEAVRKTPSLKVAINVTSDKCYDNKEWVWGYRENDPMGGKDPYSASKSCSEIITNSYNHSFFSKSDCNIASVRAGNVIGGGDWAENRIVPDFFRSIKNNTTLQIRNPYSTRPWQHVLEPISGYFLLASYLYYNSNLSGGWNFGPIQNNTYNVKILIDTIIEYCKMGSCIYGNEQPILHEANLLNLDISKATSILSWQPVLNFKETVLFTVKGYMDEINKKDLLSSRQNQIKEYADMAKALNIKWAK